MKSNIIICKTPRNDGLSNLLSLPTDHYKSAEFYMDFTKINTVQEIIDRFDWMESRGYHLRNDRGWVYRSESIANVLEWIKNNWDTEYDLIQSHHIRMLTRSGNLRQQVIKLMQDGKLYEEEVNDE